MSDYLTTLKRTAAQHHERRAEARALEMRSLDEKIRDWYAGLPPQERRPYYSMQQLVMLFGGAPGGIGTALHRLGWQRKRRWCGGASYARYWVPTAV